MAELGKDEDLFPYFGKGIIFTNFHAFTAKVAKFLRNLWE
jgi:hypothetical protein